MYLSYEWLCRDVKADLNALLYEWTDQAKRRDVREGARGESLPIPFPSQSSISFTSCLAPRIRYFGARVSEGTAPTKCGEV